MYRDDDEKRDRGFGPAIDMTTGELHFLYKISDHFAIDMERDSNVVFLHDRWGVGTDDDNDHYFLL